MKATQSEALGRRAERDAGRVAAFTAVLALAALAVLGLVLDGGLALAAKANAYQLAAETARAGAQQIDLETYRATGTAVLDHDAALLAARQRLDQLGADGDVTVTGTDVTVTITATQPTQLLSLIGMPSVTVQATATATALHGIDAPGQGLP